MATDAAEAVTGEAKRPPCYGCVIIEWPAPLKQGEVRPLAAWGCAIYDAETGKPVTTVEKITIPSVTAEVNRFITCELTMFADADGMPVLFPGEHPGFPASCVVPVDAVEEHGKIRTGTFTFLVAEMRVRGAVPVQPRA